MIHVEQWAIAELSQKYCQQIDILELVFLTDFFKLERMNLMQVLILFRTRKSD